jgi:sugar/nucleoside kinase (ribokinase family)
MQILSIGNVLVDVFAHVEDDFTASLGLHLGSSNYVGQERLEDVLAALGEVAFAPGGSAANTARFAAQLGLETGFVGPLSTDHHSQLFRSELERSGVRFYPFSVDAPTGVNCTMISPDLRRTSCVYLGGSQQLESSAVPDELLRSTKIVYAEGYLLHNPAVLLDVLRRAKASGAQVVFGIRDAVLCTERKDEVKHLADELVDVLVSSEDDFTSVTDLRPSELADNRPFDCDLVVVRRPGGYVTVQTTDGLQVFQGNHSPVVDPSGGASAFTAGFLSGYLRDAGLQRSCEVGAELAAQVMSATGTGVDATALNALRIA